MDLDLDTPRLDDPDGFYAALVQAHDGLDEATSALLNAKLVLLMAHQIGRQDRLLALIDAARQDLAAEASA